MSLEALSGLNYVGGAIWRSRHQCRNCAFASVNEQHPSSDLRHLFWYSEIGRCLEEKKASIIYAQRKADF